MQNCLKIYIFFFKKISNQPVGYFQKDLGDLPIPLSCWTNKPTASYWLLLTLCSHIVKMNKCGSRVPQAKIIMTVRVCKSKGQRVIKSKKSESQSIREWVSQFLSVRESESQKVRDSGSQMVTESESQGVRSLHSYPRNTLGWSHNHRVSQSGQKRSLW